MTVRWFVDGVEVAQSADSYHYQLRSDGGDHDVRVTLEDSSGRIRAPAATSSGVAIPGGCRHGPK
jgi:hypothetical protein